MFSWAHYINKKGKKIEGFCKTHKNIPERYPSIYLQTLVFECKSGPAQKLLKLLRLKIKNTGKD